MEYCEGRANILVPLTGNLETHNEPGKKDAPVFFNRSMAEGRDFAVMVLAGWFYEEVHKEIPGNAEEGKRKIKVLDAMAGTGIRTVRFALEAGDFVPLELHLNDTNPVAVKVALKNLERNGVRAVVTKRKVQSLLGENKYDFIDIDPYGSPTPYLPSSIQAVRRGGVLAVTATDTGTLSGSFPKTAFRRYGVLTGETDCPHEIGIRTLIGFAVRLAASFDRCLRPIFVHVPRYCYRVYFEVSEGRKRAEEILGNLGWLLWDPTSLERVCLPYEKIEWIQNRSGNWEEKPEGPKADVSISANKRSRLYTSHRYRLVGPLWLGRLYDPSLLSRIEKVFPKETGWSGRVWSTFDLMKGEDAAPFPYDMNELCSRISSSSPRWKVLKETIEKRGYSASRTHFDRRYLVRTDAPKEVLEEMIKSAAGSDISPEQP